MSMHEVYMYRTDIMAEPRDITGFDIEAIDGHIGKLDEATYDQRAACLVVDTGFWIFGKKRIVPGGVVRRIDWDGKKVDVGMTKDEIRNAPDYDEVRHRSDEDHYHDEV